jgi:hypothetical protein
MVAVVQHSLLYEERATCSLYLLVSKVTKSARQTRFRCVSFLLLIVFSIDTLYAFPESLCLLAPSETAKLKTLLTCVRDLSWLSKLLKEVFQYLLHVFQYTNLHLQTKYTCTMCFAVSCSVCPLPPRHIVWLRTE